MTTTPPATGKALTRTQQRRLTIRTFFDHQKPELSKLLPRHMDPERLFRMALSECVKNTDLLECSAESWALALQNCAAQGLYPDSGLGFMYLIPRGKQVTAQRGYQGDIRLARNTGEIKTIGAEVVYRKDHYKVVKGLDQTIEHVPFEGEGDDDDPGPLRATYAFAKLTNGEVVFVTLTRRDVMRHKASSTSASGASSPWNKHEAAMWKKTAIHELFKWIPKDTEKMERLAADIARGPDAAGAIETTAVDLGQATIPVEDTGASLDDLAAQLDAEARPGDGAPAAAASAAPVEPGPKAPTPTIVEGRRSPRGDPGPSCPNHALLTVVNPDGSRACDEQGCEWTAPAPLATRDREPGEDDEVALADPRDIAAVQGLAAKAGDTTKPPQKSRQRNLEG